MRSIKISIIIPAVLCLSTAAVCAQPAKNEIPTVSSTQVKSSADEMINITFDKADIAGPLKFLSTTSGVPIVWDSDLKGTITIICQKQICVKDAYEVINSALRVRGYSMVGDLGSQVIRVVPLKKAISDKGMVQSGGNPDAIVPADSIVTQVIPLEYVSAAKLKDELKPMVSDDQATIMAISATNTLIITDSAGNVHRMAEIIRELDKDTSDLIEVEVYTCLHSSAESLVDTLTKVFKLDKTPTSGGNQPQRQPEGGPPQPQVKSDDGVISLKGEIRIASDDRTNMLIISAARPKIDLVLGVVKKLDVNTDPEVQAKVIELQYADAAMVADQLNKVFEQPQGGAGGTSRNPWDYFGGRQASSQESGYAGLKRNMVVADARTNSVIITATEQNMAAFVEMVTKLDAPKVLSEVTRPFPLKYAKAADLADTLNRLFRGEYRRNTSYYDYFYGNNNQQEKGGLIDRLKDITVVADVKTNTLLVTSPPQAFSMIENLLESLDKRTPQVFIEVAIVDVTLDNETKFGVEWTWNSASKLPDGTSKQSGKTNLGLDKIGGGLSYTVVSNNLKAVLQALETRSDVKVYSTPTITTADNVEALISIGQDQPYISSQQDTNTPNAFLRTVDFKKVAVALTVTPHVTSDVIALDVHQTINEIIGTEPILNAPIVADREAKTSISVKDGQTIVIGGIIKHNRERITRAVPLISRVPLIGELFKSRDWHTSKSELMVFLTPHVLKDDADVDAATQSAKDRLSEPPQIAPKPTVAKASDK